MRLVNESDMRKSILRAKISLLVAFSFSMGVCPHLQSLTNQNVLGEYYRILGSTQADSASTQIAALKTFLNHHPDFERIYLKLFERFLYYERTQEAKAYFQELTASPRFRRNSHWMLAKLFNSEDDRLAAFEAFQAALGDGPPSILLLKDFTEFDQQQAGKFGGLRLLHSLPLDATSLKIATAFDHYQKLQYKKAIAGFSGFPSDLSNDVTVLHLWGECFYRLSQYATADSMWRKGVEVSRQGGDREAEAQFLTNLGIIAGVSNRYDEELEHYDAADSIARQIGDLHRLQLISGLRAFSYRDRGDFSKAAQHALKAIAIAERIRAYRYLASWYFIYGNAQYFLGEYHETLNAYENSETYSRKANNESRLVEIKLAKGKVYSYLKLNFMARKVLQEAYDLAKRNNLEKEQQEIEVKLGDLMLIDRKYAEAKAVYQKVIASQSNLIERAYTIGRLARAFKLEGRYDQAKKHYLRALGTAREAGSEINQGWYLLFLGDIDLIQGNANAAIERYRLVRDIALKQKHNEMLWQVFLSYGNAYQRAGDLDAAVAAYKQAVDIIEAARNELRVDQLRIGYFRDGNQVYRNLVQCFLKRYEVRGHRADLDSLFYYDEMSRGRALQDLRQWHNLSSHRQEFLQTRVKVRAMQHRLRVDAEEFRSPEEWNNTLADLEVARYSLLTQRLRVADEKQFAASNKRPYVASLSNVLKELKHEKSGLLFYHLSPEVSFVVAANGDQVRIVRLPVQPSDLRAQIDSLLAPLHYVSDATIRDIPFRASIAGRLYEILIKPAEESLLLPERILIVPDVELMSLPFEMLLTKPPNLSEYRPADFPDYAAAFLAHRYTFYYSPSTSFLLESGKTSIRNSRMVIFANPFTSTRMNDDQQSSLRSLTGWRFDPLPYAEVEADRIKEASSRARVLKRENATKGAFMNDAAQQQIVHLATHAFVDTAFDAFSGLVFATGGDSADDGMLMGYEISDLNLNCELITLSACETGRGEIVAGEGVLGLPRLFLGSGAKSVVMTLWKVDDRFSSALMPVFYENLLKRNLTKIDALSHAKRTMLERIDGAGTVYHQHPFYWAAFVLFGDAGAIRKSASVFGTIDIFLLAMMLIGIIGLFAYRFRHRSGRKALATR